MATLQIKNALFECVLSHILKNPIVFPIAAFDVRLSLTQVCSAWRRYILASTDFWVHYIFTAGRVNNFTRQKRRLELYTKWAMPKPVAFYFVCGIVEEISSSGCITGLLPTSFGGNLDMSPFLHGEGEFSVVKEIILPHAGRIYYLECHIHGKDNIQFLLNIPSGQFKTLQAAKITFSGVPTLPYPTFIDGTYKDIGVFEDLPYFTEATISIFNGLSPLSLRLSANMTSLDFSNNPMKPMTFIKIMKNSQAIQYASFNVEFTKESKKQLMNRAKKFITMPHLSMLILRLENLSYSPKFISMFRLPALRHLKVTRTDGTGSHIWDIPPFTWMISESRCHLEKLILTTAPLRGGAAAPRGCRKSNIKGRTDQVLPPYRTSYTNLTDFFKNIPGITHLCLPINIHVHLPTIQGIANGYLLPRLCQFKLGAHNAHHILWLMVKRNGLASASSTTHPSNIDMVHLTVLTDSADRDQGAICAAEIASGIEVMKSGLRGRIQVEFEDGCPYCKEC